MSFALDILPVAIADIAEAARWYEGQREGLGAEFALEVNGTIDSLADQALHFRVRYRRKNVRWTFPRRFPYPREAFPYAFKNGADFIAVGMFDFQIKENCDLARKVIRLVQNRERPSLA